jgi:hypothetical protein
VRHPDDTSTNLSTGPRDIDIDVESGSTRADATTQSSTRFVRDLISQYAYNTKQTVLQTCKEMWEKSDHPLRSTLLSGLAQDNIAVHRVVSWVYVCDIVLEFLKESERSKERQETSGQTQTQGSTGSDAEPHARTLERGE